MNKLIINLGASKDHYGAYAENCPGIYGAGNTVDEAKQNVMEGLRLYIKYNKENLPEILQGNYEIEYRFDVPSFLKHYSTVFTKSALQRMTGINQTQLSHYVSGFRKPSSRTIRKLDTAIRHLSNELSQVHFE
ncbi:MAG: type II toxin-antitoxin system HicB family antitoxin [Dysgonamonadaceae bacterium]|jgi:predicted RNase H-like HicB family nuclease|nr:type II toxin-antitoxin system HicB family antitoxin [Dysgonamonadaceae bacterium]